MKTRIVTSAVLGLFAAAVFLISASNAQQDALQQTDAQQNAARQTDVTSDRQQTNRAGNVSVGVLDEQTTGATVRASQLIGMNLENSKGEGVGEIHDLVIDGNNGKIRYVAVTYGGFLGLGDKLFAVPFEAFQARRQAGDRDDFVVTLDVTEQQLEGAEGFDQENWPNFADHNFTSELDRRYGIDRSPRQATRPGQNRIDGARNDLNNPNRINNNQRNLNNQNRINNNQSDLNNQSNLNGDIGADQNSDRQNQNR